MKTSVSKGKLDALRTSTHGRTLAVIATHSYNVHIKNIYVYVYVCGIQIDI